MLSLSASDSFGIFKCSVNSSTLFSCQLFAEAYNSLFILIYASLITHIYILLFFL